MARLAAEADAAMAADFAETWHAVAQDVQARNEVDSGSLDWLAAPVDTPRSASDVAGADGSEHAEASSMRTRQGFWRALCPGMRSIARSAVAVLETAATAAADAAELDRQSGSEDVQLSLPAALHARMLCTLVRTLAEQAPEVLCSDDAIMRAVLLPVLQCTVSTSTAVTTAATAALEAMCTGALTDDDVATEPCVDGGTAFSCEPTACTSCEDPLMVALHFRVSPQHAQVVKTA
jgi:hypothetical protein